ncbi:unnamed protein product [Callosobruchus maculatus]|uniref:G-patch domain-containing protein n=1 Tax=Callosobruchus maculatus TaxID=64391 RepID=A0A653CM94_CALMS|nr:unnamed protein product [Callosobruchus maculatus]
MSMLAERKRKTKYSLNPRGNQWVQDSNKFGQKLLEKMGWKHGKGLGAKEDGITEHVKVSYKNDSKGMGYKGNDDQWTEHEDKFAALLSSLTGETDSKVVSVSSLEKKSQSSRARVHYKKFTRGKDLSRYSEKDLASIFGKRSLKEEKEVAANTEKAEEKHTHLTNNDYLINSGSMADYFKSKLSNFNKATMKSDSESESEISNSFGFGFKGEAVPNQEKTTFVSYVAERKRKAEDEEFSPKKKAKKEITQEQGQGVSNPAFNPLSTPVKLERHILETIEESVNEEILEASTEPGDLDNSLDQNIKKKRKSKKKDTNSEREENTEHSSENITVNHALDDSVQESSENGYAEKKKKSKSKDKPLVEENPFEVKLKKKQSTMFAVENSQFHDTEEPSLTDNNENIKDNPYELKTKKKKSKYAIENPSFDPNKNTNSGLAEVQENPYEVKVKNKKKKYENQCNFDSSLEPNVADEVQENPYEVKIKRKKAKPLSKNSSFDMNSDPVTQNGIDNCTFDPSIRSNVADEIQENPYEVKIKRKKAKSISKNSSFDMNSDPVTQNGIDNCTFDPSIEPNVADEVQENPYEVKIKKKKAKSVSKNSSFDMNSDPVTQNGIDNCTFDPSIEPNIGDEIQENPYEVKIKRKKAKSISKNSSFDMNSDPVTQNGIDNCTFDPSIEPNVADEVHENPYEVKIKKKKAKSVSKNSSFDMNSDPVTQNGIDNCTFDPSIEPNIGDEIQENPYEVKIKRKKAKSAQNFDENINSVSENGIDNCTFDSGIEKENEEIHESPYEVKIKKKKAKLANKDSSFDTLSISKNGIDNCTFDPSLDPNDAEQVQENPYEVKIKKKKTEFAIENPCFDANSDSPPANSTVDEENPYEVKIKKKKIKQMSDDATSLENQNKNSILELEEKKKRKQIEAVSNPSLKPDDNNIPISNDIVVDDQLMLNVAVIPVPVQDETPHSVRRKKSVRFSNVNQEVIIPNETTNGIDNQCFDEQKNMLDENMQFISKTLDRFEAEIENDLNEEKQLMIGEVGNPSGNDQKLPDGTVKLKFKHANLGSKTPMYHLDKTGAKKSYKHLIKGDIVLHFKETNLHQIPGYGAKKETFV